MKKSEGKSKTAKRTVKSTVKRATRSKAVQIPEGNPKKKWTTEQLKAYIKQRTKEANKNINEYRDKVKKGDIEEYRSGIKGEYDNIVYSVAPKMETAAAIFAKNIISNRI